MVQKVAKLLGPRWHCHLAAVAALEAPWLPQVVGWPMAGVLVLVLVMAMVTRAMAKVREIDVMERAMSGLEAHR